MQLFVPVVGEEKLHHNFQTIVRPGNTRVLDVLNDWASGFSDRDNKFVREFQTTFNSSFLELYVFAVLKKYELAVNFSRQSPDFCLPAAGFNIECAVAEHAAGAAPEQARLQAEIPRNLNEFNRRSIIRLSNALMAKIRKFRHGYSKLDYVQGRPFVIAISNFDQPNSFLAVHRPIEAVLHAYYVDEERFIAAGHPNVPLKGEELSRVFKDNDAPIELGLFTTPEFREISAVMFSGVANAGKLLALTQDSGTRSMFKAVRRDPNATQPHVVEERETRYQENLLDGLRIYYNPFADHPLDPATFRHPSVFQSYYGTDGWMYEDRDGHQLFGTVQTEIGT